MRGLTSFRARLLTGSVLWTVGVILLGSVALVTFLSSHPGPHAAVFHAFITVPLAVSGAVGLTCILSGGLLLRDGWRSLERVRQRLGDVRAGRASRLADDVPLELQPLVQDVNHLLDARDARAGRAAARAADLAHALKTPLAVLLHDAARVAACDPALAEALTTQATRMARQIDRHLTQARAEAAGSTAGLRVAVAPAVDGLFRALHRLHAHRDLDLTWHVPPEHGVRCAAEDLDEMLGNLLDNACTWTRRDVRLTTARADDLLHILVDDDGPGIAPDERARVLARGGRVDERMPGSGLGLAIVGDLAAHYDGHITLESSPLGGLRARLALPAADR